jgi:hypothetical protein
LMPPVSAALDSSTWQQQQQQGRTSSQDKAKQHQGTIL